jgi:2'-5' RNA ligase
MLGFWLDSDTAQRLALPGGEDPSELHITLCYLGKVDEFEGDIEHLKEVVRMFAASYPPLRGNVGGIGRFTPSDSSDNLSPVIALVNMPGLQERRQKLAKILDTIGANVANDFDYLPHCTLAYIDADAPMPISNIEALSLRFDTLWLCIGDERISYKLGEPLLQQVEVFKDNKTLEASATDIEESRGDRESEEETATSEDRGVDPGERGLASDDVEGESHD